MCQIKGEKHTKVLITGVHGRGASQVVLVVKNSPASAGDLREPSSIPGLGRSPGGGNGNISRVLAWRIPWTEESGGLQSMRLQKSHAWLSNNSHIWEIPRKTWVTLQNGQIPSYFKYCPQQADKDVEGGESQFWEVPRKSTVNPGEVVLRFLSLPFHW